MPVQLLPKTTTTGNTQSRGNPTTDHATFLSITGTNRAHHPLPVCAFEAGRGYSSTPAGNLFVRLVAANREVEFAAGRQFSPQGSHAVQRCSVDGENDVVGHHA